MRVISQCGRGDFPYEQISLVIRNFGQPDQWLIVAHGLYFKDDLGTRIFRGVFYRQNRCQWKL